MSAELNRVSKPEPILCVKCVEPEGTFLREVRLANLSLENLQRWWDNLKQFPTLFGGHIFSVDDFILTFVTIEDDGEIKAKGIVWEVDDVGIFYLTDIQPGFQASGHFSFWDRRLRGREDLCREALKYAFKEFKFHRITTYVPLHVIRIIPAVKKIGFVKEGRLRSASWYKGDWYDVFVFSILEGEL